MYFSALPGNGIILVNSGVKQCLILSPATEMSSFSSPLIHLSFFNAVDGRFRSKRNL